MKDEKKMKIKDSTIICLLIITWTFTFCAVLGAENEVDRLERQIAELSSSHQLTAEAVSELIQRDKSQNMRLDAIEQHNKVQDLRLNAHREELSNLDDMFEMIIEDMTGLEKKINALPKNSLGLKLSDKDIRNIASLVYLEAGSNSCSYQLQKAIASVIFNRMKKYHLTATQAIYQAGVFSTSSRVSRTTPSERCMRAVREVMANGVTLPANVVAFRTGQYHSFGRHYCKIDNVYFTAI